MSYNMIRKGLVATQYTSAKARNRICCGTFKALKRITRCVQLSRERRDKCYEGWNFNSGNYLFTTDTK